jgi:hypothetical protein
VSRNQLLDCKTYQYFFFSMQFSRYILTDFISHQWPPPQWNPLITGKPSGK